VLLVNISSQLNWPKYIKTLYESHEKKSHRKKVTGNKVTRKKVIIPRYICQPGSDTKIVLGKKVTGKMSQ
jgi:hypothetical protein